MKKQKVVNRGHIAKLQCNCGRIVNNCSSDAVAVKCWSCVSKELGDPTASIKKKSDKPAGWQRMKVFVYKDGTVYFKGEEQTTLHGTLPVTEIKIKTKTRVSKKEKDSTKNSLAATLHRLKRELETEENPQLQQFILRKISEVNKSLEKYM